MIVRVVQPCRRAFPAIGIDLCVATVLLLCGSSARAVRNEALGAAAGDYYANIDTSLRGAALRQQLTDLISVHDSISYAALWAAFEVVDERVTNRSVTDFESCRRLAAVSLSVRRERWKTVT